MSQAIHHFPASFQDTDKRLLKYAAIAIVGLSVYLAFGTLTLCSLGVLAMSGIVLKGKADKMANMAGRDFTAISRDRIIDGGTFQQESEEKAVNTRSIVLDGGSFERHQV